MTKRARVGSSDALLRGRTTMSDSPSSTPQDTTATAPRVLIVRPGSHLGLHYSLYEDSKLIACFQTEEAAERVRTALDAANAGVPADLLAAIRVLNDESVGDFTYNIRDRVLGDPEWPIERSNWEH